MFNGCRRRGDGSLDRTREYRRNQKTKKNNKESSYLVRFLSLLPGVLGGRLLQQGGDDVVGDVEELLVDLLVLPEVVVSGDGENQDQNKGRGRCTPLWESGGLEGIIILLRLLHHNSRFVLF